MVAKDLLDNVLALPAADRQELFERLRDSLLDEPALTDAQRALLDARLADMELRPDDEMSLEEVERGALRLTDVKRAELDRRVAEMRADPALGASWEEVKARVFPKRR